MSTFYPLLFEPVLKDYIWGGRNLADRLQRPLPPNATIAESWEIAAHADGATRVTNGPLAGQALTDLIDAHGVDLVGRYGNWALERGKFPLLVKLLDATTPLSVQVHPDDDYALAHEGNELGKSEMWVVLHAEPGAEVILGVTAGTTRDNFRAALTAGRAFPHPAACPRTDSSLAPLPKSLLRRRTPPLAGRRRLVRDHHQRLAGNLGRA